jgi:DnaJ domain
MPPDPTTDHTTETATTTTMTTLTHYQALQIPSEATPLEIKRAFHKMARQWHPDRRTTGRQGQVQMQQQQPVKEIRVPEEGSDDCADDSDGDDNRSDDADEDACNRRSSSRNGQQNGRDPRGGWFVRIQEAWECLRDPARRAAYDHHLQAVHARAHRIRGNAIPLSAPDCFRSVSVVPDDGARSSNSKTDNAVDDGGGGRVEEEDVEADADGGGAAADDAVVEEELVYTCRCGTRLRSSDLPPEIAPDIVPCPGCSLLYNVAPLFEQQQQHDDECDEDAHDGGDDGDDDNNSNKNSAQRTS